MSGRNGQAIIDAQPDMTLEQVRERMQPHAERVAELRRRYAIPRGVLLQALWMVQEEFGWVPRVAIKWAAEVSEVSPAHAFGVVEFYTMYLQAPVGRYLVQICETMCCQLFGADDLIAHLEQKLGIHAGETTEDGMFTLLRVQCLASCGTAPAILINDEFLYGPDELNQHVEGWHPTTDDLDRWLERLRTEAKDQPNPPKVDGLGGIILGTAGHPGADGATGEPLPKGYAPAPPALQVKAESAGEHITVSCLCAPECSSADVERSDDGGQSWAVVGTVDVTTAPGVPGPPGGPKTPSYQDTLALGKSAQYRVIAKEKSTDRVSRPSAVAEVTAVAVEPEEATDGGDA